MKIRLYTIYNEDQLRTFYNGTQITQSIITVPNVPTMGSTRDAVIGTFLDTPSDKYVSYFTTDGMNYAVFFEKDTSEIYVEPDEPEWTEFPNTLSKNEFYKKVNYSYDKKILISFDDMGIDFSKPYKRLTLYGSCVKDIKANEIHKIIEYHVSDDPENIELEKRRAKVIYPPPLGTFKQFVQEEYTYMYNQIPFDYNFPIKDGTYQYDKDDPTSIEETKRIDKPWEDIKQKILLFFEVEYKRSKAPRTSYNKIIDNLYNYFINLQDAYLKIYEWYIKTGKEPDEMDDDQDTYWRGNVDHPYEDDPKDIYTRKLLAINSIINLLHRDTKMLTRYLEYPEDAKWEEMPGGELELLLNIMARNSKQYTHKWDKELEQEFGI